MARRGGYSKSDPVERLKTSQQNYAQAITSAARMEQDLTTWLSDAIAHHVYRCEMIEARSRFLEARQRAAASRMPEPLETDYMPTRPPPTITRTDGRGSNRGLQPRPR